MSVKRKVTVPVGRSRIQVISFNARRLPSWPTGALTRRTTRTQPPSVERRRWKSISHSGLGRLEIVKPPSPCYETQHFPFVPGHVQRLPVLPHLQRNSSAHPTRTA